jgi:hypothetical protein
MIPRNFHPRKHLKCRDQVLFGPEKFLTTQPQVLYTRVLKIKILFYRILLARLKHSQFLSHGRIIILQITWQISITYTQLQHIHRWK